MINRTANRTPWILNIREYVWGGRPDKNFKRTQGTRGNAQKSPRRTTHGQICGSDFDVRYYYFLLLEYGPVEKFSAAIDNWLEFGISGNGPYACICRRPGADQKGQKSGRFTPPDLDIFSYIAGLLTGCQDLRVRIDRYPDNSALLRCTLSVNSGDMQYLDQWLGYKINFDTPSSCIPPPAFLFIYWSIYAIDSNIGTPLLVDLDSCIQSYKPKWTYTYIRTKNQLLAIFILPLCQARSSYYRIYHIYRALSSLSWGCISCTRYNRIK